MAGYRVNFTFTFTGMFVIYANILEEDAPCILVVEEQHFHAKLHGVV
jgi:hypothetical protein